MKKFLAVAVAICSLFCAFALTGCDSTGSGNGDYETVTVKISGSSSVSPLMAKLADAFMETASGRRQRERKGRRQES